MTPTYQYRTIQYCDHTITRGLPPSLVVVVVVIWPPVHHHHHSHHHPLSLFSLFTSSHIVSAISPLLLPSIFPSFLYSLLSRFLNYRLTLLNFHFTTTYLLIRLSLSIIMRSKFKDEHPFEKRKAEAERIRQKYADRIPVCIHIFSLRLGFEDLSLLLSYLVTLSPLILTRLTGLLHNRSSARRSRNRTSPLSTRRNIWYLQTSPSASSSTLSASASSSRLRKPFSSSSTRFCPRQLR